MIDIDALGEKGEQRFGEICADAGLICNKARRDHAGWDFVVNFREPGAGRLDVRQGAPSCYVQVKTILDGTRAAKLKLNMAERLAKEPKPSFVLVLKVDASKAFTGAYLIHVVGNRLGAILKRLRAEELKNPDAELHEKHIYFAPGEAERIGLTGDALRAALLRHIGNDIATYIHEKQRALMQLGYAERPFQVTTKFQGMTEGELADLFLGLRSSAHNTLVKVSETRFDITISEPETLGSVEVQPNPTDSCRVTYLENSTSSPVGFRGDLLSAPPIGDVRKMRIRGELIDVVIEIVAGISSVHFTFAPNGKRCKVSEWVDYWRFLRGVFSKRGSIEIQPDSAVNPISLSVEQLAEESFPARADIERYCLLNERFADLCDRAGVTPDWTVSGEDIWSHANAIVMFQAMSSGEKPELQANPGNDTFWQTYGLNAAIAAGCFSIGDKQFAIYGTVEIDCRGEGETADVRDFTVVKLRTIPNNDAAFDEFVGAAATQAGVKTALIFSRGHFVLDDTEKEVIVL